MRGTADSPGFGSCWLFSVGSSVSRFSGGSAKCPGGRPSWLRFPSRPTPHTAGCAGFHGYAARSPRWMSWRKPSHRRYDVACRHAKHHRDISAPRRSRRIKRRRTLGGLGRRVDVDLCGHVAPLVSLTGWPRWIFEVRQVAVSVFRVASACAFLQDDLNRGLLLIVEKLLHRAEAAGPRVTRRRRNLQAPMSNHAMRRQMTPTTYVCM